MYLLDAGLTTTWKYQEQSGYGLITCSYDDGQNIYLGGKQQQFNEQTGVIAGTDAYLVKLDKATGSMRWKKNFQVPEGRPSGIQKITAMPGDKLQLTCAAANNPDTYQLQITTDTAGNVTAHSAGNITVAADTLRTAIAGGTLKAWSQLTTDNGMEIAAALYNQSGSEVWRRTYGGPGYQAAYGLAAFPSGTIIITGMSSYYNGTDKDRVSRLLFIKTDKDGKSCY